MSKLLRRIAVAIVILLLAGPAGSAPEDAAPGLKLTPDQKAWIKRHGAVRLGVARTDWPPFDIVSGNTHSGITADYLALIEKRSGLRIEPLMFDTWERVFAAARAGDIDLVGSTAKSEERARYLAFTAAYVSNPPVLIARKDQREVSGIDDLDGRTVAVEEGFVAGEVLKARYPGIKLRPVRTTGEALLEVSFGRADAYVGDLIVSTYLIDRNYLTNLEVRGPVALPSGTLHFAVRKNLPVLRGIVDATLATITEPERREIRQRWVPVLESARAESHTLELSPAERAWIAAHPRIRVGVDPAFEPLDFLDDNGRHSGLASEYLKLLRERVGLNLEVVPGATWTETLERGRRREVDMIALMTPTPERKKDFLFTSPYVELPIVLVTRANARPVSDLRSIEGETVAIMHDYFASEHLLRNYPGVVPLPVASMDEALSAVDRGYAFATAGSLVTLGARIQERYVGKLKLAATLEVKQELAMGVRTDWPELAALLDRGLASISAEEHQALRQKWLTFKVEYGIRWREVAQVGVPIALALLAILAVIVVANRKLKRQIAETERKDVELKVQLSFQRALMDTIPSPILFKDSDARIYGCNRAFEEAFGAARDEMLGCTVEEAGLFLPEQARRMYEEDLTLLKEPDRMLHDELRLRFADELDHVVLYWKTAFRLMDGSVGGLLAVIVDITPLKQLEQAAHEARNAADAANRAKSSFLATMSHEIRTPMNAVLGMLELMSLGRLDPEQMRSLNIVRESAKSLLRIIDDILDFSKIEAGKLEVKPEAASVEEIVDGVILMYSGVASSKNLLLKSFVDPQIGAAIQADPVRLRQILNNFTSNALKFTEQGEVELRVDLVGREAGRETLKFSVRDTGIGISKENQSRLFQPFMQAETDTTRRFGGTGLGLAICRRLAELMGGSIDMQSEPGKGTTLTFIATFDIVDAKLLPSASTEAPRIAVERAARRAAPSVEEARDEGTLILVADDHPINRMLLVRQLNTLGYAAEAVEDGRQALERWPDGKYALLLTDCHMPVMDGYELAREIRRGEAARGGKRLPVIACTANALQGEAEICFAAGMDDFIPKPVEMADLLSKLDKWLPVPGSTQAGPAPSATEKPVPDNGTVIARHALAEISGGDAGVEREILLDFRDASREDARSLEAALDAGDLDAVRRAAHRMKGSSRMVGALDLAGACERIERAAGARDGNEVSAQRASLIGEIGRLEKYLGSL